MRKYGFKLFSTNLQNNPAFVDEAAAFVRANNREMFIELMVVPTTPAEDWDVFRDKFAGLEVTIHAPHNTMNFDTGYPERFESNAKILDAARRAAGLFDAKVIVVHAGGGGERVNLEETARQFRLFDDPRIVIENLPFEAEDVEGVMHGTTPEQIKYVTDYAGCGFCFDFSHAVCAANSLGLDIEKQLSGFYKLNPTVYHLCDGDINGTEDRHMHYGEGSFPLKAFLQKYVAADAMITMETGMGMPKDASAWIKDFDYLHQLQEL